MSVARYAIAFTEGKARFNYRIVGCVLHDRRVLLHRAERDDFWALPGGRGELLEPSAETLRREMREELGVDARVERLLWVVENFFENEELAFHEVALYYLMSFPPGCPLYGRPIFEGDEEGVRLIFQWHPVDQLEGIRLFPTFLRTALQSIPGGIVHVVHTDVDE